MPLLTPSRSFAWVSCPGCGCLPLNLERFQSCAPLSHLCAGRSQLPGGARAPQEQGRGLRKLGGIARALATISQCGVGLFSLAMNKHHLIWRLLTMSADIDLHHVQTG